MIYSDIDTVWLKDPRLFLKGNYDFWAQIDGVIDGYPYVNGYIPFFCTGFMALSRTEKTMNLIQKWKMELADNTRKNSKTNQPLFQKAVYEISANGRILPMAFI